jgi:phosphoglucosamine mutase
MTHLFGTDGIRGRAGTYPLDAETVRRVGAALIEAELAHGASGEGASVTSVGVVPTPAVAYLTRAHGYDAGVVISASHNPFEDNGIKVFSGSGQKHGEHFEERIEEIVADGSWHIPPGEARLVEHGEHLWKYLDHARTVLPDPGRLKPLRLAVDCANGAMTVVAPALFKDMGFDVTILAAEPDGRNINKGVGSTHPDLLAETVRGDGYRLGVAFDGDGDRAIFVDGNGRVLDGDHIMFMCAKQMKAEGRLRGNAVVATVMSNIGLELGLKNEGITLRRTGVGDKYVMEEMQKQHLSLGGEQSGHLIFSEYLFTGDGLITALSVLRTMASTGRELADLADDLKTYPQVLKNVRVREKVDLKTIPQAASVIKKVEERLSGHGRLLVRFSGTEPLVRVMLEGEDRGEIEAMATEIVEALKASLS